MDLSGRGARPGTLIVFLAGLTLVLIFFGLTAHNPVQLADSLAA